MFATTTMYAFNCPLFGRPTPQENLGKPDTRGQTVSLKAMGLLYICNYIQTNRDLIFYYKHALYKFAKSQSLCVVSSVVSNMIPTINITIVFGLFSS